MPRRPSRHGRRLRNRVLVAAVLLALPLGLFIFVPGTVLRTVDTLRFKVGLAGTPENPDDYPFIDWHFKYGSLGTDNLSGGIPYWVFRVMPRVCRAKDLVVEEPTFGTYCGYLADSPRSANRNQLTPGVLSDERQSAKRQSGEGPMCETFAQLEPRGDLYDDLGLLTEPGKDRPIGFSNRTVFGVDLLGPNCALCHTSVYRAPDEETQCLVYGMPAHQLDLECFFRFIFACAESSQFTVSRVMSEIDNEMDAEADNPSERHLGFWGRLFYRLLVWRLPDIIKERKRQFDFLSKDSPPYGRGRVATWSVYKAMYIPEEPHGPLGVVDFPSIWNQEARYGKKQHWDGNNDKLRERNIIAALGPAMGNEAALDFPALVRVEDWMWSSKAPQYPQWKIEREKAKKGEVVYRQVCAECHDKDGESFGKIMDVGTDRQRVESFTPALKAYLNDKVGDGYPWKLKSFITSWGYVTGPLDGIWLRAPYLHNGSVPTLWHLLHLGNRSHTAGDSAGRPTTFCVGSDRYDWDKVGFDHETTGKKCHDGESLYDTTMLGNNNGGHSYGTELSETQKANLIEYLKTL